MVADENIDQKQQEWADQYRNQLAELGLGLEDSSAEAQRQLQLMRESQINPVCAKDWDTPAVAAGEYLREHPIQKTSPPEQNIWDDLKIVGIFLCGAAVYLPLMDWFNGELQWQTGVDAEVLLAIPFVVALIIGFLGVRAVSLRAGVWPTLLAGLATAAAGIGILFIPRAIWGDSLKQPFFYLPVWAISAMVLLIGVLLHRIAQRQGEQAKQRQLLRSFDLRKAGATQALNQQWFSALNIELRSSYHFTTKMVSKTLSELRDHLQTASQGASDMASAEEEFGPVSTFAYEIARNNAQAVINSRRFELLTSLFYLVVGVIMLVAGSMSWWQNGHVFGLIMALTFGLGITVIYGLATKANFALWKRARRERVQ